MKKALILGVSGQDGSYLVQLLLSKGYQVYGTARDAQTQTFDNLGRLGIRDKVALESVAITDFRSILQVLLKTEPDEIYNLAGQSSVGLSFQQPVETFESISVATVNILEAIRFSGLPARFYNACSGECFGDTPEGGADEDTAFRPKSPYGVAKAAAFWHVSNYREAYGLFACSGILFNHESPLRPDRFVTKKIVATARRIAEGSKEKIVLGDTAIERDWGWAPEYVEAMWLMLQQDRPDDYVIATGESHSLRSFAEYAFEAVGLNLNDHLVIDRSLFRPLDINCSKGNPAKAKKTLLWQAKYRMKDVVKMMVHEGI